MLCIENGKHGQQQNSGDEQVGNSLKVCAGLTTLKDFLGPLVKTLQTGDAMLCTCTIWPSGASYSLGNVDICVLNLACSYLPGDGAQRYACWCML